MATGTIKKKTDKGFGFISMEGSDDLFFHNTECNGQFDSMQEGQAVQFDVEQGQKGPKAVRVVAA
ncbi:MAG: cold shock domain-containing protein [Candidatus Peregrinibacteria bacterium]